MKKTISTGGTVSGRTRGSMKYGGVGVVAAGLVRARALVAATALVGGSVVGLQLPAGLALAARAPDGQVGLSQPTSYAASVGLTAPRLLGWGFNGPDAMVPDGPDLFVANGYGNSVTELPT